LIVGYNIYAKEKQNPEKSRRKRKRRSIMMTIKRKKALALCGSTRQNSSNHSLLLGLQRKWQQELDIVLFENLAGLPHFNPDLDQEPIPDIIAGFRQLFTQADGVIICTPEYAHGVPGTLKNALDWTVSSSSFSGKPTALVTASTDGQYGHRALLETLRVIEAKNVDELQLLIPFAKTKISSDKGIFDESTNKEMDRIMIDFISLLNE
jgi:chromate reductase, NAD(P)H dehydrogenase (quinone)